MHSLVCLSVCKIAGKFVGGFCRQFQAMLIMATGIGIADLILVLIQITVWIPAILKASGDS